MSDDVDIRGAANPGSVDVGYGMGFAIELAVDRFGIGGVNMIWYV